MQPGKNARRIACLVAGYFLLVLSGVQLVFSPQISVSFRLSKTPCNGGFSCSIDGTYRDCTWSVTSKALFL